MDGVRGLSLQATVDRFTNGVGNSAEVSVLRRNAQGVYCSLSMKLKPIEASG